MKYIFIFYFLIIYNKNFINTEIIDNNECPIEKPLRIKDSSNNNCVYTRFDENIHEISNNIIKTQFLNKINLLGGFGTWFIGTDFSSKGDLIIQSFDYGGDNQFERFFYGIKKNGRNYFYIGNNNKYFNQISITSTTTVTKYESEFIKINLINDIEEKDYYLSTCFENNAIELIDFYNNQVIGLPQQNFFGDVSITSLIYNIFEINKNKKIYIFCFIGNSNTNYYVYFQKIKFYDTDISQNTNYDKILISQLKEEFKIHNSFIISCFEIAKYDIIQCFYMNITNYLTVGIFSEDSFEFLNSEIIDNTAISATGTEKVEIFYKSILLKKEISVLGYILDKNIHNVIYIQIKEVIYNKYSNKYELEDYLIEYKIIEIKIDENFKIDTYYYLSDLKKLNDNKFVLVSVSQDLYQLYVILFELYNFHDTNLFIRYYYVPMKLYNFYLYRYIRTINFNEHLGLIYTNTISNTDHRYQRFSIFSYVNGTDSELINLDSNTFLKLNNYIKNENLENNIFAYDLYAIKILKLPNTYDIGVYYFSKLKNNIIFENDILSLDDEIYFVYDYDILSSQNEIYTIEIAGIAREKIFSDANNYIINSKYYGNSSPESFYKQKIYLGRTSFLNFTIPNLINGVNSGTCKDNCKVCYNSICIKCITNYALYADDNSNTCQENIIEEGYYYNENPSSYRKCQENCKTCLGGPIYFDNSLDIKDTNCDKCIDNYYKIENTNNCIDKDNIPETYYFNSSNNIIGKCFENCKTCAGNQVNSTYYSCLTCDEKSILYEKSGNCLNCYAKGKYANHYENECINFIPDGYYLENEENKALGLCYFLCKKCDEGGYSNDHKCTECGEDYPYQNREGTKCLENCSIEFLYTDIPNQRCYNDCLYNIDNERIYNYKNICLSLEEKPNNYEVIGNNFVRICDNLSDYFFNNECYENSCPENTKLNESETSKKICICNNLFYLDNGNQICINDIKCPDEYPFLKPGTSECTKCFFLYHEECFSSCPENTYINETREELKICVDIIPTETIEETTIKTDIISETEIINNGFFKFSDIIDQVEKLDLNTNIVINKYQNVTINIYLNGVNINELSTLYPNLTFINLEKCEQELKTFYKLDSDENLYLVTYENLNDIENRVTNQFQFEIYLKNGTELEDLSACNNFPISVSSSIAKLDKINYDKAEIFNSQGYDIYNLSSGFYKDKCTTANINGNDIILKDRIEDIYPHNASFCSNGCELNNVEIESKRVSCSCDINYTEEYTSIFNNDTKTIAKENFLTYLLDNVNYQIFECYKILFDTNIKNLISNVAFFFGAGTLIFNFICFLIFSFSFLPSLRIKIFKLLPTKKILLNKTKAESKKNLNNDMKKERNIYREKEKTKTYAYNKTINTEKTSLNKINKNKNNTIKLSKKNNTIKLSKKNSTINVSKRNNTIKLSNKNVKIPTIRGSSSRKLSIKKKIYSYKGNEPSRKKYHKQSEENMLGTIKVTEKKNNNIKLDDLDMNYLPYSQALEIDNRNFFSIYFSLIKFKIDIISILFFPEEFTHRSLTLSLYVLNFLFSFFMNAFLYTDEVVSEKYHNNGQLNLFTTLFLSITSNIVSSIIIFYIKKLVTFREYLASLVKDINRQNSFILTFKKLYIILKIKAIIYFIISFILTLFIIFYLLIFCQIYKKSQNSLIINYLMSLIESLVYSVAISLIICILRFIGLKCKNIYCYRTSVFLDQNF